MIEPCLPCRPFPGRILFRPDGQAHLPPCAAGSSAADAGPPPTWPILFRAGYKRRNQILFRKRRNWGLMLRSRTGRRILAGIRGRRFRGAIELATGGVPPTPGLPATARHPSHSRRRTPEKWIEQEWRIPESGKPIQLLALLCNAIGRTPQGASKKRNKVA